ncbi:MAG: hypothetical protein AB7K09_23580 [Planctomycetota bacterium]
MKSENESRPCTEPILIVLAAGHACESFTRPWGEIGGPQIDLHRGPKRNWKRVRFDWTDELDGGSVVVARDLLPGTTGGQVMRLLVPAGHAPSYERAKQVAMVLAKQFGGAWFDGREVRDTSSRWALILPAPPTSDPETD